MKKIYYSVIFSLAFSLFSCSDFLDRESLSELSNGNFWNTEADATKALVGCYDALQSNQLYNSDQYSLGPLYMDCISDNGGLFCLDSVGWTRCYY